MQGVAGLSREVYGTRRADGLVRRFLDTLLVLGTVVGGLTLLGAVAVALSVRVSGLAWSLLAPLLLFVALAVAFLPTCFVLPGTRVSVGEAVPGAALAAAAWTLLGLVFRWYVTTAESVALYGVAGAVLVVLSWLSLGGLALLLGAVLAGRVTPDETWLPGDQ